MYWDGEKVEATDRHRILRAQASDSESACATDRQVDNIFEKLKPAKTFTVGAILSWLLEDVMLAEGQSALLPLTMICMCNT